jgi:pyruvate,orthophosphate dikinase
MVSKEEAVLMVEPRHLDQLLHPMFEETDGAKYKSSKIGKGLPASPGAAMGRIVFTADDAEKWRADGEKVGSLLGGGVQGAWPGLAKTW